MLMGRVGRGELNGWNMLKGSHNVVSFPWMHDNESCSWRYTMVDIGLCEQVFRGPDKANHGPMYHRTNYEILRDTAM